MSNVTLKLFRFKADPNSDGILFREFTWDVPASMAQTAVQHKYDCPYYAVHIDTLKQYPNTRL